MIPKHNKATTVILDVLKKKLNIRKDNFKNRIRFLFAFISIIVQIIIFFYIFYSIKIAPNQPNFLISNRPFNDLTKAAIDVRLNFSSNIFQISIIIFGGIWGILITKKGEITLIFKDLPELIMALSSMILIIFSLIFHYLYIEKITKIYSDAGIIASQLRNDAQQPIPDIFDFNINYLFISQNLFFYFALMTTFFTFISTSKLKPN